MDLDELLSFKPSKPSKRTLDNDGASKEPDDHPPVAKRRALRDPVAPTRDISGLGMNGISEDEKLRILQSLDKEEEDASEPGEVLDVGTVKRMLLSFEKKVLKNQEMRIKFPDLPEKFMESELELNDEIQKMNVIATVPEHYPILIEMNAIQTLVGLLSHDNSDVAIAVIDLLQELTDVDTVTESEEEAQRLIEALLNEQVVALLVQNLERLDEKVKEDSDGVHNTLAIIENMCEFKNEEVGVASGEQGLLVWLLKRLRVRQYDANKLYASEILAILLQGSETNHRLIGEKDGIDILLQSLAYYKRRDPASPDEAEMMENLFDCLCSSLMFTPNRDRFLRGEGLQLMILMLKEKKVSRRSALKVLNHAMCNAEGADNCMKFVEVYGLRSLFPVFMKTPKMSKKAGTNQSEHEEHVCSIIASLLRNVQGASPRERLIGKFTENDHEKVDRLMELHFKYRKRIRDTDEEIRREKRLSASASTPETEIESYIRRLDAGLFTLQLVDYIILELYLCGTASVRSRIGTLLSQHGDSLETVRGIMREYVDNMGDASASKDSLQQEKQRIATLVDQL